MSDDPTGTTVVQSANGHGAAADDDVDFVLDHLDEFEKEPKLKRVRRVVTPFTRVLLAQGQLSEQWWDSVGR